MSASLRPLKGLFLIRIINPVTFPLGIRLSGNDLNFAAISPRQVPLEVSTLCKIEACLVTQYFKKKLLTGQDRVV